MYAEYETPKIGISFFYYDDNYEPETAEAVVQCLESNRLFPPNKFLSGHLTNNRYRKYKPEMRDLFIKSYSEKDIFTTTWKNVSAKNKAEYFDAHWTLTYHKSSNKVGARTFKAWNVITLFATYDWISVESNYWHLIKCMHELVPILHPFNLTIDDIANANSLEGIVDDGLLKGTAPPEPCPRHLRTSPIYWGNYWGPDICKLYDVSKLAELPVKNLKEINGGVFFTLTDNVMEFDTPECKMVRSIINTEILHK